MALKRTGDKMVTGTESEGKGGPLPPSLNEPLRDRLAGRDAPSAPAWMATEGRWRRGKHGRVRWTESLTPGAPRLPQLLSERSSDVLLRPVQRNCAESHDICQRVNVPKGR